MKTVTAILAACALVTQAWAVEWAWLKIENGPSGEAIDKFHAEWIRIDGFGLKGEMTDGEPGAFKLEKRADKSTPRLFEACLLGTIFPSARLDLASSGPDTAPDVFTRIELRNVRISHIDSHGDPAGAGERLTLSFEEIRYSYFLPGTEQGKGLFAEVNFETGEALQGVIGGDDTPPPPVWFTATLGRSSDNPDMLRLSWPSTAGSEYTVEWSPDLKTPFVLFRSVPAEGTSTYIDLPMDDTMGFFRVALP